jgi:hypothetical protein
VGCIKDLNINGANIDLVSYAHQQDSGIVFAQPAFNIAKPKNLPSSVNVSKLKVKLH